MSEKRAVASIAGIMCARMLGLFMILPVFSVAVGHWPDASPRWIGFAIGAYGLTQACLQLPFGFASDRWGRKPVITVGLILFAVGSVVAAYAHTMPAMVLGRALQGAGAVGSTLLALCADLTPDETRTRAMAMMGMSIGLSFALAMVLGPLVNAHFGLSGIFWFTAMMAVVAMVILWVWVPKAPRFRVQGVIDPLPRILGQVLRHPTLWRLDLSILCLHALLTATFVVLPHILSQSLHLSDHEQTWLYAGVLVLSFILMIPGVIFAEKKRHLKGMMCAAVVMLLLSQCWLAVFHLSVASVVGALLIFFTAFTLMESCLPSLVSKVSPLRHKGTAMGVFSSSQFFGIFLGGSVAGLIWAHGGLTTIFWVSALMLIVWLIVLLFMQSPPYLTTWIWSLSGWTASPAQLEKARQFPGVHDVLWIEDEHLLYLKVDRRQVDEQQLRNALEIGSL